MNPPKNDTLTIIEGLLFAEGKPLSIEKLRALLPEEHRLSVGEIRQLIEELKKLYENRGIELVEVASGYRFQIAPNVAQWLITQREEKPLRLSKAFMETLALIAYRQPITRGEIEEIRGVVVNTNIIKNLLELEWIREVGYKDVPGKPALLATTKKFLDFFNMKSLQELPPLAELQDLTELRLQEDLLESADIAQENTIDNKRAELTEIVMTHPLPRKAIVHES
ncbi:MAG TPA: SMC-Scp complex subunit ScpB [Gammaproteobacteria bacterium]|nr:SMC-Scp complex subunit ScpB [Gammaproteobacteria bacterium]